MLGYLSAPIDDYLAGLGVAANRPRVLWLMPLAAALSWWVYVPIHELLHAYGCLWSGGEVTRLEIDAIYGAAWLQQWFPFVAVGSEYAGQLTGFDTRGSDLIYLATDALPFVLTIFPGVPLLRSAATATAHGAALRVGAAIPLAFAPFISLTGDYYEMGSILVSRLVATMNANVEVARWRSDDLFLLIGDKQPPEMATQDWVIIATAFVVGAVLAWTTYLIGRRLPPLP